jgi:hypothetical protein
MAVSVGNLLLLTGSVLAAVCAIFWPQMEQAYVHHAAAQGAGAAAGVKGKCPLVSRGFPATSHILVCSRFVSFQHAVSPQCVIVGCCFEKKVILHQFAKQSRQYCALPLAPTGVNVVSVNVEITKLPFLSLLLIGNKENLSPHSPCYAAHSSCTTASPACS